MLDMFDIEDSTTSPSALTIDSSQFQPDLVDDLTLARINYQKSKIRVCLQLFPLAEYFSMSSNHNNFLSLQEKKYKKNLSDDILNDTTKASATLQ